MGFPIDLRGASRGLVEGGNGLLVLVEAGAVLRRFRQFGLLPRHRLLRIGYILRRTHPQNL